jgi:nucleotide-binding universal stress UspA family protein
MKDSVPKTIAKYLMDASRDKDYIDFVAVGNQGANFSTHSTTNYLGSVANEVIRHTKLNVLFVA